MTITVTGAYRVHADDDLAFDNATAFDFAPAADSSPSALSNAGRITVYVQVDFSLVTAVFGAADKGRAEVRNGAGATLAIVSSGLQTTVAAVDLQAEGSRVVNLGTITADSDFGAEGARLQGVHETICNRGVVDVTGRYAALGVALADSDVLRNTGSITARADTVATGLVIGGRGGIVVNHGTISALDTDAGDGSDAVGILISYDGGYSSTIISNHGLISASTAVRLAASNHLSAVLNNYGEIDGAVQFGPGVFSNYGKVVGDIDLGNGTTLFANHRLASIEGVVSGGGGRDGLTGGKAGEVFYGDGAAESAGDGGDTMRGGGGDDQLFGGGRGDIIWGGHGGDILSGGTGADTFVFSDVTDSRGGHLDLITDLQPGDEIDLSRIDADTTLEGDQSFRLVRAFDHNAGELALSYDTSTDETRLQADVDGDGQADMTVLISGRHGAIHGLVL